MREREGGVAFVPAGDIMSGYEVEKPGVCVARAGRGCVALSREVSAFDGLMCRGQRPTRREA